MIHEWQYILRVERHAKTLVYEKKITSLTTTDDFGAVTKNDTA